MKKQQEKLHTAIKYCADKGFPITTRNQGNQSTVHTCSMCHYIMKCFHFQDHILTWYQLQKEIHFYRFKGFQKPKRQKQVTVAVQERKTFTRKNIQINRWKQHVIENMMRLANPGDSLSFSLSPSPYCKKLVA